MDKNPLLKYMMKDKKEDVIHSSAYASAQNKGIGTSSIESFTKRRAIDQNRTVVKRYNDSQVVNEARTNAPRPKTYEFEKDATISRFKPAESNRSSTQPVASPKLGPQTPPPRRNPGIYH